MKRSGEGWDIFWCILARYHKHNILAIARFKACVADVHHTCKNLAAPSASFIS